MNYPPFPSSINKTKKGKVKILWKERVDNTINWFRFTLQSKGVSSFRVGMMNNALRVRKNVVKMLLFCVQKCFTRVCKQTNDNLFHLSKRMERVRNSLYQFSDVAVLWNCRQNCGIVIQSHQWLDPEPECLAKKISKD